MPRFLACLLTALLLLPAPASARRPHRRSVSGSRRRHWTVALDAGHGGRDPGALARGGRLVEKRVALDVTLRLARYLRARGCRVCLSRAADRTLPPPRRA